MTLDIVAEGQVQILSFCGEMDAMDVQEHRAALEAAMGNDFALHVIDASELDLIDSSGIGLLVYLHRKAADSGSKLALAALNGQPADMIRFLKIDQRLPVFDSVESASAA